MHGTRARLRIHVRPYTRIPQRACRDAHAASCRLAPATGIHFKIETRVHFNQFELRADVLLDIAEWRARLEEFGPQRSTVSFLTLTTLPKASELWPRRFGLCTDEIVILAKWCSIR
eukprot:COSAG02_NODE_2278_length_9240_cov_2.311016_3_plen_116_part_00